MAEASLFLMESYNSSEPINVGTCRDYTIREISDLVKEVTSFEGEIVFDTSRPSGMMKKLIDSTKINSMGWEPKVDLEGGMILTYDWYLENGI